MANRYIDIALGDSGWGTANTEAFDSVQTDMDNKADINHTHGEGGTVVSIVQSKENLGTGATVGELKSVADSSNVYVWTGSTWQFIGLRYKLMPDANVTLTLREMRSNLIFWINSNSLTADRTIYMPSTLEANTRITFIYQYATGHYIKIHANNSSHKFIYGSNTGADNGYVRTNTPGTSFVVQGGGGTGWSIYNLHGILKADE